MCIHVNPSPLQEENKWQPTGFQKVKGLHKIMGLV